MNENKIKKSHILKKTAVYTAVLFFALCFCACSLMSNKSFKQAGEDVSPEVNDFSPIVDPYEKYTYDTLRTDIGLIKNTYPSLIDVYSIGLSAEGRDIPAFNMGRGDKNILIFASIHGNEYISTAFVMYMADTYLQNYVNDGYINGMSVKEALDSYTFVIVPMINPDGVNIAQNGPDAAASPEKVKSMALRSDSYAAWKSNSNGVDLNRNFPYFWSENENVPAAASAEYRGEYAASEPETKALIAFIDNTEFVCAASFHTYGEVLYWADSKTPQLSERYYSSASNIAGEIGYELLEPENIESFGGYMINYMRGTYGKFCITVELCPAFFGYNYPESDFDNMAEDVLQIGLLLTGVSE